MLIHSLKKDLKYRLTYKFFEKKKNILKSLIYSLNLSLQKRYLLNFILVKFAFLSSISKIKNKCIYSGRSRGIVSKYKISRHFFKKLTNSGKLYPLKKK